MYVLTICEKRGIAHWLYNMLKAIWNTVLYNIIDIESDQQINTTYININIYVIQEKYE